ncbi:hypothetical protein QQ045_009748 [Rhodiola kirilowii]
MAQIHIAMYPWLAMGHLTSFLHFSNKLAERNHKISFFIPAARTQHKLTHFNLHPHLITFIPITVPNIPGLPEHTARPQQTYLTGLYTLSSWSTWTKLHRRLMVKAEGRRLTVEEIIQPPSGFPHSCIKLKKFEAKGLVRETEKEYGEEVQFTDRLLTSVSDSDAIWFKTCQEIEGSYADYVGKLFNKPVLLAGPVLPEMPNSSLDEKWVNWLDQFEPRLTFAIYILFLLVERVAGRGLVCGEWVPQQLMLAHRAIGCFVTHCGYGSLSEALVNECQVVLLPNVGDQIINARMMGEDLRVGVEVEKGDESGLFDRDGVCRAVKAVMDGESEIGKVVRANHTKWRAFLLRDGLERNYVDSFVKKLRNILTS